MKLLRVAGLLMLGANLFSAGMALFYRNWSTVAMNLSVALVLGLLFKEAEK